MLPIHRTYDGTQNNPIHSSWGSAGESLLRRTSIAYEDGISAPAGAQRPNARSVSNAIFRATAPKLNARGLTDFVWLWGQFLSHTFQIFKSSDPVEDVSIIVPQDDIEFPPGSIIGVARSAFSISTGTDAGNPRQQLNFLSAFIDASNVYGADESRATVLRTMSPVGITKGALQISPGNLMPLNTAGLPNQGVGPTFFLGGDVRANDSFDIMALHTLFVREHNRLAANFVTSNPSWTDEIIYQRARTIVGAQLQAITYNEFLPALLGPSAPGPYGGYNTAVNPGISDVFATVGFRYGHSMVSPDLVLKYDDGRTHKVRFRDAFFNVGIIQSEGIDPVLRGLACQVMQETDTEVIDDLRNVTITAPGNPKLDLVATDIQRARDHGIPDYNRVRLNFGLPAKMGFADITQDADLQRRLQDLYGGIDNLDPLVGGMAEPVLPNSSLGELLTVILQEQFERLRTGDRFWYQNDPSFSMEEMDQIGRTRLSDLIRRNTSIRDVQDNVFVCQ